MKSWEKDIGFEDLGFNSGFNMFYNNVLGYVEGPTMRIYLHSINSVELGFR